MNRFAPALGLLFLPWLNGCMCCGGCSSGPPETPAERAAREAETVRLTEGLRVGLATAAANPPATAGQEGACPDAEIGTRDYSTRRLLTVDRPYLVRLGDPDFDHTADDRREWEWMRSEVLQEPSRGADKFSDSALRSERQRHYLAVLIPEAEQAPMVAGDGTLTPGHWGGWVAVVDLDAQQEICRARLAADSSPRVQGQLTGSIGEQQTAVDEDFQEVFGVQLEAAVERISDELHVGLDWTN